MQPKEFTDEVLVRYLDGEVPPSTARAVQKRLAESWPLRNRLAEIEEQIRAVARAAEEQDFPGPAWTASNWDQFARRAEQYEQQLSSAPRFGQLPGGSFQTVAAAPLALLAVAAALLVLWWPQESQAEPDEVLARVEAVEQQLSARSLYQKFTVQLVQKQPVKVVHSTQLDLWWDSNQERFASRWTDPDGSLKHAVWRSTVGEERVYDASAGQAVPRRAPESRQSISLVRRLKQAASSEQLESLFLRWLETRRWRPVSLTADLLSFVSEEGVGLVVESAFDARGERVYRLSAARGRDGEIAEITIEVDARTYQPRMERIRIASGSSAFELTLVAQTTKPLSAGDLARVRFEPELHPQRLPSGQRRQARAPRVVEEQPQPSLAELDSLEFDVRFVLHRTRACLGEPLEVVREGRRVVVRGYAEQEERRVALVKALSELASPEVLGVEIRTITASLPTAAADQVLRISGNESPLRIELMERRSGPNPAELNELVSQLSTDALLLSEASLVDAWALRRLADRYGHVPLAAQSKWLLEVMINDHREVIARNVSAELAILRRILEAGFSGADEIVEPPAFLEAPAGSWGDEVLTVFGGVVEIDGLIHAALAASSEPPDQSPSRILSRLVAVVPEVQSRLSRLAASESPLAGSPSVATR